jgi:hypothetical protein
VVLNTSLIRCPKAASHRGVHETVDEDRARFLDHFVLHRFALHRELDDHIEIVEEVLSGRSFIQTHYAAPSLGLFQGKNEVAD